MTVNRGLGLFCIVVGLSVAILVHPFPGAMLIVGGLAIALFG